MAVRPQAPQPEERHYKIGTLNKWFAIGSIVLLITIVASFAQDYGREWKRWQRQFRRIDRAVTRGAYDEMAAQMENSAALARAREQVAAAEETLLARQDEVGAAEREVDRLKARFDIVNSRFQNVKAQMERARYRDEQAAAGTGGLGLRRERTSDELERRQSEFAGAAVAQEEAQLALDQATAALQGFEDDLRAATRARDQESREADLLMRRLVRMDPEFSPVGVKIANVIRDLPILDLSQPSLRVDQVVLADIRENLNFAQVPRVDRCVTCHQGVERADLEGVENPHGAHPRLALFVASDSPHPLEEFGCTSCHGGRGRATDFVGTVHIPNSEDQLHDWEQRLGWKEYHLWEEPMHPQRYAEAGCFQCHSGQTQIRGAAKLSYGLDLIEQAGCYSCHEIASFAGAPKRGPSLRSVADKLSPQFAFQWIKDPAGFRAQTWMPAYFGQSNNSDPEAAARTDQEVIAIVSYLFANSTAYEMEPIPVRGDPVRGEELVASVGCMACHQAPDETVGASERTVTSQLELRRQFGPNFQGLGSKTSPQWIYHWLKDPTSYHPETRMPNLRLTDQEASDITSYLMDSTDAAFAGRAVPAVDEAVVDRIALDFLSNTAPMITAQEQLAGMNRAQKLEYSGERLISQYGCFACHDIAGFEDTQPIGAVLTDIGRKALHQFDYGFLGDEMEHSRTSWWTAKLTDPRVFDRHRDLEPLQQSRMPNFRLTDQQVEAMVTALAGFVEVDPQVTKIVPRTPRDLRLEAGQRLVRQMNCQGCHIIEGEGGAVVAQVAGWLERFEGRSGADAETLAPNFSPPNLLGEGRKVQTDWLFAFFHEPSPIRPWLRMRMPSYGMSAERRNGLIAYFTALDEAAYPFAEQVQPELTPEELTAALTMFSPDYFNCTTCHIQGDQFPPGTPDRWAPDFALASQRLRADWIIDWLADPQSLMPGTRMPAFYPLGAPDVLGGDTGHQLEVLRDYLLTLGSP